MVDFKLTNKQLLAKKLFAEFAEKEIKPIAAEMDETEVYSLELLEKLKKVGLLGIPYDKKYGGAGADVLTYAVAMEEVSKVDASTGITMSVHTSLCCPCINDFGTEEQKEKYLRPLVNGTWSGCFSLTEPGAGTDASGAKTIAEKTEDGKYYVLNGQKVFTTNGGFADVFIVFALTDKTKGPKGMSAFIVEKGTPGMIIGENIKRMGIRAASNVEVAFVDCKVPAENLLGKEGKGYGIAMGALAGGRIGIAAQATGIAQGALNEAIKYSKERKQFGKPLSSFQHTQFQCVEMQTRIDAARLLTWRAAKAKDDHENYTPLSAMAKLYASQVAVEVTRFAVQLMGGYGYSREYPVERMYRDAKITEIYEGTSEAMKMVAGGAVMNAVK
ncbi:acyl-CoA dehydrogenase family protein [Frisingicoccus sp.]|uniref:acyl-CoA dehydrogenase family protein n=1 Tax=Frisingicoccus sp. TaxID=1918627 RepID=UPI0025B99CCB|nr:acyl-CoA dehydrogenase family protein [Frisingicoccus sp.]MDD6231680.1 acyl-CoA dehydrogenase family protein [Frisingicoccus sp.]MDY4834118.1 acyl-CoA dehydrogenase family protein [Frisingicoccus sp.]MDY4923510.1 acyl-CoA dehydrogenase family protein [Frisingicoccus sp.]MDY5956905.1 acyl-CoA dehydrogenase family protein [Frisingicoccus sp.]